VPFRGFVDLLLRDKENNPVVIDLKWTRSADKYRRQEIEDGLDLQLASYAWLIERKQADAKINAGYFLMPNNSWLSDTQENLRQVFANATNTWQNELEKLSQGIISKGRDKDEEQDDGETSTANFKLNAPCNLCQYEGLCKIDEGDAQ
jgi:CRISPR/Cas system-associated exonuclease Cas4 (RecB family)